MDANTLKEKLQLARVCPEAIDHASGKTLDEAYDTAADAAGFLRVAATVGVWKKGILTAASLVVRPYFEPTDPRCVFLDLLDRWIYTNESEAAMQLTHTLKHVMKCFDESVTPVDIREYLKWFAIDLLSSALHRHSVAAASAVFSVTLLDGLPKEPVLMSHPSVSKAIECADRAKVASVRKELMTVMKPHVLARDFRWALLNPS